MSNPAPFPPGSAEQLKVLLKQARTKTQFQRVQCLWLRAALGLNSQQVALALGWSASSVRRLQADYVRRGEAALRGPGRGGRRRQYLQVQEEHALLARQARGSGPERCGALHRLQEAYEQAIGHSVPASTIYRVLARQGWRRIAEGAAAHIKGWPWGGFLVSFQRDT